MNKINQIIISLLGITLFSPSQVVLASFQHEAGLFIFQTEDSDGDKTDGTALYYQYFLNSVSTASGPWAEAGFINRSANIGVMTFKTDGEYATSNTYQSTSNSIRGDVASPDSDLVFSAAYFSGDTDYHSFTNYSTKNSGYSLGFGYFVQRYTLISFEHEEAETRYSGISSTNDYDSKTNAVLGKMLIIQDATSSIVVDAGYSIRKDSDGDEFRTTLIYATYYPEPRLGVGASYAKYSNNVSSSGAKSYGVYANYYFVPGFRAGVVYNMLKSDGGSSSDADVIQLTASAYF